MNSGLQTFVIISVSVFATFHVVVSSVKAFQSVIMEDNSGSKHSNRSSKWLPFIVIIGNNPCNSTDSHEIGTCFTKAQCRRAGGTPKGSCASEFGVCCIVVASCSDIVSNNNTYFRSRSFPDQFKPKGNEVCTIDIIKPTTKDVCQVLLTLHDMVLANTSSPHGHCLVDSMLFFGVTHPNLPHLCGPLSKQHLYLEFGKRTRRITMTIVMDGFQEDLGRKWNVQISYIGCLDPHRAPNGCLQYFRGSTGSLRMLGYPTTPHLAGLAYTVCVRRELGAESIFWFPCRDEPFEKSFHFQGPNIFVTSFVAVWGICLGDYIAIMSDDMTSTATPNIPKDRYCGNRLTARPPFYINSRVKPFIIVVRTDLGEHATEVANTGFCLEWYQVIYEPNENSMGMPMPEGGLPPEGP